MTLLLLLLFPFVAGLLAYPLETLRPKLSRWLSLLALAVDFVVLIPLWRTGNTEAGRWISRINLSWIPELGIRFHLAADGLSLLLITLTLFLGIVSVIASWNSIQTRVGLFHLNLLWIVSGLIGVFLALDLFLFYLAWELMLVPMYFLISIWGYENKARAAIKFFIFTQAGGLLMLVSILALYFSHGSQTGLYTFDYEPLLASVRNGSLSPSLWIMLGFFTAFAVKLPAIPLHTWLPDAHTEAPTAGSVILAGLLLKTGGYGLLRFVLPLFPTASAKLAPIAMALAVAGIIYGSVLAFAQKDLKRLVAYTSVSHLGFVLLGIFAGTEIALQGAIVQMICHGISTGALFILVGSVQERLHTRDVEKMGGLWRIAPKMGSSAMFFAMASLGLPGLGNFVGEFLTLLGTFQVHFIFGAVATFGFVVSTLYSLRLIQAVFHGKLSKQIAVRDFPDFSSRELAVMGAMMLALLWIGFYPQSLLDQAAPPVREVCHVYR